MPPNVKHAAFEDTPRNRCDTLTSDTELAAVLQRIVPQTPQWTRPPSPSVLFFAAGSLAESKATSVPGSIAQSPKSPWLSTSQVPEKRQIKRRIDPIHVPEAVGIVEPTWLPYATPPPSRQSQRSKSQCIKKTTPHLWSSRHHLCDSKDNRCLPKLQRAYFDDLPKTRCQGGVYSMVPGHRSFNFDQFCTSPAHIQQQDLHRHFDRYPFLEFHDDNLSKGVVSNACSSAFGMLRTASSSSSEELDARSSPDLDACEAMDVRTNVGQDYLHQADVGESREQVESASITHDCNTVATAWDEARPAHGQRSRVPPALSIDTSDADTSTAKSFKREPSSASAMHELDTCRCDNILIADSIFCRQCGKRRQSPDDEDGSSTRLTSPLPVAGFCLQSPRLASMHSPVGSACTSKASTPRARVAALSQNVPKDAKPKRKVQKKRDSTEAWRCSVFAKGGVPQFHTWCELKFGSMVRLWRCIDTHNNMRIAQGQFLRSLQDLGYSGDARELFKALNRDKTGTLLFYHFAPEAALAVADLLTWARSSYGSLAEVGLLSAVDQRSFISRQQFVQLCKKKGYTNEESLNNTYDLIDKDGDGSVVRTEVAHLDKWEFPEWLIAKPDEKAADACKTKLLLKCNGNALLAWRHMNRGGSMRVSWNDFKFACRRLLSAEDCQQLPAAWRVLDNDLSGWLSLREFDKDAHDKLLAFMDWTHDHSGSILACFPKLVGQKDAQMTLAEFRYICKQGSLGDDVVTFIFAGLDVDNTGTITASELRFLDQWKATSDLREEEAWSQITLKSAFRKVGSLQKIKYERARGSIGCLGKDRHRRQSGASYKSTRSGGHTKTECVDQEQT